MQPPKAMKERSKTFNSFVSKEEIHQIFITNEMKIETNCLSELKIKRAALVKKFHDFVSTVVIFKKSDKMKMSEMYSLSGYLTMLEKTDLVQTKKQIKELYLQNILSAKETDNVVKKNEDKVTQAYFDGRLTQYLDNLKILPGFEKEKNLLWSTTSKKQSIYKNKLSKDEYRYKQLTQFAKLGYLKIKNSEQNNKTNSVPKSKY